MAKLRGFDVNHNLLNEIFFIFSLESSNYLIIRECFFYIFNTNVLKLYKKIKATIKYLFKTIETAEIIK